MKFVELRNELIHEKFVKFCIEKKRVRRRSEKKEKMSSYATKNVNDLLKHESTCIRIIFKLNFSCELFAFDLSKDERKQNNAVLTCFKSATYSVDVCENRIMKKCTYRDCVAERNISIDRLH